MAERTVQCVTCHHPLLPGQVHPPIIGQPAPEGNTQLAMIDSLTPLFRFLAAVQEAICQLSQTSEGEDTIHDLSWLGQELTGEIQRRADWLYELGKASQDTPRCHRPKGAEKSIPVKMRRELTQEG